MKTTGIALILCAAFLAFLRHRRAVLQELRLTRAICDDLALLRCRICVHRHPLPVILREELRESHAAAALWSRFCDALDHSDATVRHAWESSVETLGEPLGTMLTPLGEHLTVGGDTLSAAVEEVREELLRHVKSQQEEISLRLRLSAAMLFGCAAWFILIFV